MGGIRESRCVEVETFCAIAEQNDTLSACVMHSFFFFFLKRGFRKPVENGCFRRPPRNEDTEQTLKKNWIWSAQTIIYGSYANTYREGA